MPASYQPFHRRGARVAVVSVKVAEQHLGVEARELLPTERLRGDNQRMLGSWGQVDGEAVRSG
eukprot:scaffold69437_cov54-Phaeocystis_antarctica.AAC.1